MNKDDYGYSYEEWVVAIVGGVVMMSLEIAGWSMFYISYKDLFDFQLCQLESLFPLVVYGNVVL